MDYDEQQVIETTVLKYHTEFMTQTEHSISLAFLAKGKAEVYGNPSVEVRMRTRMSNLDDPNIAVALETGYYSFRRNVTQRILRDHGSEITFNRCSVCNRIVGTPTAKWCKWCRHDWH